MQGVHLRKYGVEAKIPFVLYEVDGVDFRVDAADGGSDCTLTKDEGAEATCDNDFVDEGTGYSITLTATEMEAARITVYVVDSATKVWLDDGLIIETYGNASAQHAFDLDAVNRGTDSAALASGVDVTKIHGTAINETSPGRIAGNFTTFWDNADAATAKTVDDVGAPAAGGGSPLVLGAGDVGDFKKDGVVHFFWNTIDRSGAAVAPSTAGTLRIYVDDGTGEITAPTGITDNRAFDGVTGVHECKVNLNSATQSAYAKGKNFSVILVGAVVDTKTVNIKVGSFSIENRWANVHWEYGGK